MLIDSEVISFKKNEQTTCIPWHTEQCPYRNEDGVSQDHSHMDQDVKRCKTQEGWGARMSLFLKNNKVVKSISCFEAQIDAHL